MKIYEKITIEAMKEYWDTEFLKELDKYAYTINEHKLIDTIKKVISLALDKQIEEFESVIESCMIFSNGNKIDKVELREKLNVLQEKDGGDGR